MLPINYLPEHVRLLTHLPLRYHLLEIFLMKSSSKIPLFFDIYCHSFSNYYFGSVYSHTTF